MNHGNGFGDEDEDEQQQGNGRATAGGGNFEESNELNETQKLQLAERANEIYRQQLKYMQDHLASLRSLIQDKENIIENLMLRYDLGIITQDSKRNQGGNLQSDEIELEELRRKAEALAQRTILENFELREMVNELRDENFHLRNEIYELQDKINRQVLQINKLEKRQAASNQAELDRQQHADMATGTDPNDPNDGHANIFGMDQPDDDGDQDIYGIEEEDEEDEDEDEDDEEDSDETPPPSATNGNGGHGRRESRTMEHPSNSVAAQEKRQERDAKHVRKESVAAPNMFEQGDESDSSESAAEEAFMDDAAKAKRAARKEAKEHARKESMVAPDFFGTGQTGSVEASSEDDNDNDADADADAPLQDGYKRRGSQVFMDEAGKAKRQQRQAKKHHRRESSMATPNIFAENYDGEKAEKIAKNKAKKDSEHANETRLKRKAKKVGQAAVKHVKSHRRKESLAEKLLLGPAFGDELADMKNADPEERKEMQARARKEQRRKSRQLIRSQVGAKDHFSDDDVGEDKPQRSALKNRKLKSSQPKRRPSVTKQDFDNNMENIIPASVGNGKRPSVILQPSTAADAQNSTKHRRDSSAPVVSLGFEDPDVVLHFEKLKVKDLENELKTKLDELDDVKAQLASKAELEVAVSETRQSAEKAQAACAKVERQMSEAVESKSALARKCAMEIMRLTMILNTLQRHPKIKHIVELLLDESAQKTNNKGGLLG